MKVSKFKLEPALEQVLTGLLQLRLYFWAIDLVFNERNTTEIV